LIVSKADKIKEIMEERKRERERRPTLFLYQELDVLTMVLAAVNLDKSPCQVNDTPLD